MNHNITFQEEDGYNISKTREGLLVCYDLKIQANSSESAWRSGSALTTSLPFFVMQLFISNVVYRILFYISTYLYIPRIVPQIICGVLLGPSGIGETVFSKQYVFPYRFTMVLETFANLALVYYMFLVGLEMDLKLIMRSGTKALSIAVTGILFPLGVGWGLFWVVGASELQDSNPKAGAMFYAIALSTTNFPDLARILADLKLLRTDTGKTAMSAAIITDLFTWVLLIVAVSIFSKQGQAYAVLSTFTFILLCAFALRPALSWLIHRTTKGGTNVTENHIWFILAGVALCGLITDACGAHSIVGAFMLGVILPQDHIIRTMLVEKLDDFVSWILMPLFYIVSGLRTDLGFMIGTSKNKAVFPPVILVAFASKIVSTFCVSLLYSLPPRDGLALGMLMNTKGIMALIIINAGRDMQALDNKTFPVMVLALFVMSLVVQPILALTYKPKRMIVQYKNRTIQRIKQESEFRILACIHNMRNASGIINLLQVSNPTKRPPICVFAIHLVELTGRTTASVLIQNDEVKSRGNIADRTNKAETDQIIDAFQNFEQRNEAVIAQTVTAVSPYSTMHEDICSVAEDKRVSLIILPFHKKLTADGRMGEGSPAYANINQNVLANAPCSVGILVDRGMGTIRATNSQHGGAEKKQVAMLFVGGPDDREALSYAWRMVGDPTVSLMVVRFIPGEEAMKSINNEIALSSDMKGISGEMASSLYERERQMDDEFIYEFTFKTMNDSSIAYVEKVVNDGQDTIAVIRDLEDKYDLYIVGRGQGVNTQLTAGLSDWTSCPELGTIGDTLGSSNFTLHASVLVVQQYYAGFRSHGADQFGASTGNNKNDAEPFMIRSRKVAGHDAVSSDDDE